MEWTDCINRRIVKTAKRDDKLISSLRAIAEEKKRASDCLEQCFYYAKISLLYDAVRMLLECLALEAGFHIYNHECYTPFLREILSKGKAAVDFESLRIVRNGINYYGTELQWHETHNLFVKLDTLYLEFKSA